METIDAAKEDHELIAAVSLLNMGIKTVPEPVLRKTFSQTATVLLDLMKRFVDDFENQNVLRAVSIFFYRYFFYISANTYF